MNTRKRVTSRPVGRPGNGAGVRGAILGAALRQLEETGSPDRVTIAAIVAEAGCTPPSLYHYWPTREQLLHEASERGWAQFRAGQATAVRDTTNGDDLQDPVERLRLRGRAYLEFALARPALFRVLFLQPPATPPSSPPAKPSAQPPVMPLAPALVPTTPPPTSPPITAPTEADSGTGQALDDLVNDVVAAMAAGQLSGNDPLITALALWSAMHGVASLWAVTPSLPTDVALAVGNLAQDAVLRGLRPAP
jgi:AcrR family transcriptional regulator